jgi:hypothetical protein
MIVRLLHDAYCSNQHDKNTYKKETSPIPEQTSKKKKEKKKKTDLVVLNLSGDSLDKSADRLQVVEGFLRLRQPGDEPVQLSVEVASHVQGIL